MESGGPRSKNAAPKLLFEIFIIKWLRTATKRHGDREGEGRLGHERWLGLEFAVARATWRRLLVNTFQFVESTGSKTICDLQKVQTTRLVGAGKEQ